LHGRSVAEPMHVRHSTRDCGIQSLFTAGIPHQIRELKDCAEPHHAMSRGSSAPASGLLRRALLLRRSHAVDDRLAGIICSGECRVEKPLDLRVERVFGRQFREICGGFYGDHPINQNLGLTQWFDSRRFSLLFHQDFFLASHGTRVTHLVGRRSNVVRSFGRSGRMS
jgi:hypothetical protein